MIAKIFGRGGQPSCIFCDIISSKDMSKIIYEDENVVVFPDIKPAAPHHYLIVPKEHILDAKTLGPEHKSLVEKMVETANKILEEKGCNMSDISLGFHWPPFTTVSHLHLHAISPQSEMSIPSKVAFRPDSLWYVSVIKKLLPNKCYE